MKKLWVLATLVAFLVIGFTAFTYGRTYRTCPPNTYDCSPWYTYDSPFQKFIWLPTQIISLTTISRSLLGLVCGGYCILTPGYGIVDFVSVVLFIVWWALIGIYWLILASAISFCAVWFVKNFKLK